MHNTRTRVATVRGTVAHDVVAHNRAVHGTAPYVAVHGTAPYVAVHDTARGAGTRGEGRPRWTGHLAGSLVLLLAIVAAGCEWAPAGSVAEEATFFVGLDWGTAGMPLLRSERELSLEQLHRRALQLAAREEGAVAAQALQSRLQPVREAVPEPGQAGAAAVAGAPYGAAAVAGAPYGAAAVAGAPYGAAAVAGAPHGAAAVSGAPHGALRAEMARIVLEVFGPELPQRVIEGTAPALAAAAGQIADAGKAGGPTAVLERMLTHATSRLNEARAALDEDNPIHALQFATDAVRVAGRVRMRAAGPVTAPTMPRLLAQAWAQAVSDRGQAAATALFAPMREKNAALKASLRTRELGTVRAAQEALRSEQIHLVVTVLGATAPEQVLDDAARVIEERATRAESMKLAERDVSQIEATLREAAEMHAAGVAALDAGNHIGALDLALQAADRVVHTRAE
jgi:hypothetical protein